MTKRFVVLILVVLIVAAGWRTFISLGNLLHHEDNLAKADAIYVLGGTRIERPAEAGMLYREGWAPLILLSRQVSEPAEVELRAAGLRILTEIEVQRDVLQQMGVPGEAIDAVQSEQVATASEVDELARVVGQRHWQRVIVVTSKLHTARSRLAMRRRFEPMGTEIIMRASRFDTSNVDRWWVQRGTLRFVLFETQKMVAYAIGIGD